MKHALLSTLFLLGIAYTASGVVTIQVNGGLGLPQLVSSSTSPLPDGSRVEIGTFDSGFDIAANQEDLASLQAAWNLFGQTATTTLASEAGRLADAVSHTDASFDNQRLFLWAFHGVDDEYAIFSSDAVGWEFPEEGGAMPSTLISTADVTSVYHGEINAAGNLQLRINLGSGASAVPEPNFALGWIVVLSGLLVRRKRRE